MVHEEGGGRPFKEPTRNKEPNVSSSNEEGSPSFVSTCQLRLSCITDGKMIMGWVK